MMAYILDRISLLASATAIATALAWLVFHPAVYGALQLSMVGGILVARTHPLPE